MPVFSQLGQTDASLKVNLRDFKCKGYCVDSACVVFVNFDRVSSPRIKEEHEHRLFRVSISSPFVI